MSYSQPRDEQIAKDPTCKAKREFIEKNNLVVWRFTENWQARGIDGQLVGLTKALKWDSYHRPAGKQGEPPYHKGDCYFVLPEISLTDLAQSISEKMGIRGMRVIGAPDTIVRKAALFPGMIKVSEMGKILEEPDVDAVVIGEPVEWEASPYFQDVIATGAKKGLIIIGLAASEDPGSSEVALWLGTVVPEVPVEWIPTGDPFWMLKPMNRS